MKSDRLTDLPPPSRRVQRRRMLALSNLQLPFYAVKDRKCGASFIRAYLVPTPLLQNKLCSKLCIIFRLLDFVANAASATKNMPDPHWSHRSRFLEVFQGGFSGWPSAAAARAARRGRAWPSSSTHPSHQKWSYS